MNNKKGAGAIVAWVLLIGFSIGLATTVFLWTTRQTEEMSESAIRFVEGGMQCDNVMINVACEKEDSTCKKLTVTNTRYLNIKKVLLRRLDPPESKYCNAESELPVHESIDCSEVQGWSGNVEVMPLITVNNDLVACKNKAITIQCDQCKS